MTEDEAKKWYDSYQNNLKFQFWSYYKYHFTFKASCYGVLIKVGYGNNSDDIYKYQVSNEPFNAPSWEELKENYDSILVEMGKNRFIWVQEVH